MGVAVAAALPAVRRQGDNPLHFQTVIAVLPAPLAVGMRLAC
jgi:hypothetical protein